MHEETTKALPLRLYLTIFLLVNQKQPLLIRPGSKVVRINFAFFVLLQFSQRPIRILSFATV